MKIYDNPNVVSKLAAKTDFAIVLEGNKGLSFEGKYKIEKFDECEVLLKQSGKRKIKISGNNLAVGTLAPHEIGINGIILSIEFL